MEDNGAAEPFRAPACFECRLAVEKFFRLHEPSKRITGASLSDEPACRFARDIAESGDSSIELLFSPAILETAKLLRALLNLPALNVICHTTLPCLPRHLFRKRYNSVYRDSTI
ncbi:hypothetical protein M527_15025 [Sphingobium indicum IP26]|uniref:Uncharacterized protein n=1 Tax=Sphingobium indicum F2 TaxID=1450518 RepID=A0A8E0WQ41_9SPHN|nr:hypothetical protein M527_15025 [Sphingobium indicum IP26]KER35335.1 hypothetical protein AL00_17315 [Sphingobium indicum F2]